MTEVKKASWLKREAHRAGIGFMTIVMALPSALLGGLPVMLSLGIGHSTWHACPPLGYWSVVVMLWATRVVTPYRTTFKEATEDG